MTDDLAWKRLRSRLLLDRSPWLRVFADDVELADRRANRRLFARRRA